jgi:ligand-binding SRPBCC domain-containing protein
MKLIIETEVYQDFMKVKEGFTESLFLKLNPPFPPVKLIRFDGSETGNLVSLELNFLLFRQKWTSEITDHQLTENEFFFVDEGVELPFFLKSWRHKHRLIKSGNHCLIRDEIEYEGPNSVITKLLFPLLKGQFLYRKPIYKKVFGSVKSG